MLQPKHLRKTGNTLSIRTELSRALDIDRKGGCTSTSVKDMVAVPGKGDKSRKL